MQSDTIEFKGLKNGLYAIYKGRDGFKNFLQALEERLNEAGEFFAGACLAGVYGIELDEIEKDILSEILKTKYKMQINNPLSSKNSVSPPDVTGYMGTKFVHSTLRSGQSISYAGNVVVLGDVNAGAEIEAGGSIVVMGSLRGTARAGVHDSSQASISAISLQPTQLKIGRIAARWPDEQRNMDGPEVAYVEHGIMYVRPISDKK